MSWKRRQALLYEQRGGRLPGPSKSPASSWFSPLIPTASGAPHRTQPGKAAHLVQSGRFVRGLQPNRTVTNPATGRVEAAPHWGIDINAPIGTPVYAAKSGTVTRSRPITGYGNSVVIRHDTGGTSELHGHLHESVVREGQHVTGGALIGAVGRTSHGPDGVVPSWGRTMGAHLHWEIHPTAEPTLTRTARRLDPVAWLQQQGIEQYGRRA